MSLAPLGGVNLTSRVIPDHQYNSLGLTLNKNEPRILPLSSTFALTSGLLLTTVALIAEYVTYSSFAITKKKSPKEPELPRGFSNVKDDDAKVVEKEDFHRNVKARQNRGNRPGVRPRRNKQRKRRRKRPQSREKPFPDFKDDDFADYDYVEFPNLHGDWPTTTKEPEYVPRLLTKSPRKNAYSTKSRESSFAQVNQDFPKSINDMLKENEEPYVEYIIEYHDEGPLQRPRHTLYYEQSPVKLSAKERRDYSRGLQLYGKQKQVIPPVKSFEDSKMPSKVTHNDFYDLNSRHFRKHKRKVQRKRILSTKRNQDFGKRLVTTKPRVNHSGGSLATETPKTTTSWTRNPYPARSVKPEYFYTRPNKPLNHTPSNKLRKIMRLDKRNKIRRLKDFNPSAGYYIEALDKIISGTKNFRHSAKPLVSHLSHAEPLTKSMTAKTDSQSEDTTAPWLVMTPPFSKDDVSPLRPSSEIESMFSFFDEKWGSKAMDNQVSSSNIEASTEAFPGQQRQKRSNQDDLIDDFQEEQQMMFGSANPDRLYRWVTTQKPTSSSSDVKKNVHDIMEKFLDENEKILQRVLDRQNLYEIFEPETQQQETPEPLLKNSRDETEEAARTEVPEKSTEDIIWIKAVPSESPSTQSSPSSSSVSVLSATTDDPMDTSTPSIPVANSTNNVTRILQSSVEVNRIPDLIVPTIFDQNPVSSTNSITKFPAMNTMLEKVSSFDLGFNVNTVPILGILVGVGLALSLLMVELANSRLLGLNNNRRSDNVKPNKLNSVKKKPFRYSPSLTDTTPLIVDSLDGDYDYLDSLNNVGLSLHDKSDNDRLDYWLSNNDFNELDYSYYDYDGIGNLDMITKRPNYQQGAYSETKEQRQKRPQNRRRRKKKHGKRRRNQNKDDNQMSPHLPYWLQQIPKMIKDFLSKPFGLTL